MTFNFLGPGLTVNVEAKVKEQIILDSSEHKQLSRLLIVPSFSQFPFLLPLQQEEERRRQIAPLL